MPTREHPGICGVGAVSGYGTGTARLWEGLLTGKSAAQLTHGYGHDRNEDAWVARVPEAPKNGKGASRYSTAMLTAAREAIDDARRRGWRPGRTVGLVHAAVLGDTERWEQFHDDGSQWSVRDYLGLMPSTPVTAVMKEHGLHGPVQHICAMCASGAAATLAAKQWLDDGVADDVVVLAADVSATPANVAHFAKIGVAITDLHPLEACQPFRDTTRGFVFGEAAAGLVLSRRSGAPYARVLGGAMRHDAHHVISVEPSHSHVLECVSAALEDAGIQGGDVRYHYAHGPGTTQCDNAEIATLERFFPDAEIFSTKQLTGHCQGAAAALEIGIQSMATETGLLPAPPEPPDAGTGHPRLLTGHHDMRDGATVKTALGMGGYNAAVVLAPPG